MFAIAKRVMLFLALNFLVMITISLILNVLGVGSYISAQGLDVESLLVFCLVWGMAGSLISLALSRVMAKMMMGVEVVDPQTHDPRLRLLVDSVYQASRSAGLRVMPQVGLYESPEVNAFATGPTRSRALVAVSSGLLQRMDRDALEGVIGHEVAHVANGDMVTMTLLQGVVNAFVMFLARVVAFAIMQASRGRDEEGQGFSHLAYSLTVMVLEIVFMIFGSMVVASFSRYREFRADAGGARLMGRDKMIHALESLQRAMEIRDPAIEDVGAFKSMRISNRRSWFALFSSHPPLETRIERLMSSTKF